MKTRFFLIIIIIFFGTIANLNAEDVRLYTSIPLHSQSEVQDKLAGHTIEILDCIFDHLPRYHFKTNNAVWKRVLSDAQKNKIDGWFGYMDNTSHDHANLHSAPISLEKWYWLKRKNSAIDVKKKEIKTTTKIGVLNGSYANQWLIKEGYQQIRTVQKMHLLSKMLITGRIDLVLVDDLTFQRQLNHAQTDASRFERIFLKYVPINVHFTHFFLKNHPNFLKSFNGKISECVPDVMKLSENDLNVLTRLTRSIRDWSHHALIVKAINASNQIHATLNRSEILKLDRQWRNEKKHGGGVMIQKILNNKLSEHLAKIKNKSNGLYSEIFVMDNRGLNVGQSDSTTDYWQGDEAKFKKTFHAGLKGLLIDDIVYDTSSQRFQSQVSLTITDPVQGRPVGAITVGIDVEVALASP